MNPFFNIILEVAGTTLPIFAVVAIGFFIKKRGLISEKHVPVLNRLTYNFGLSALVFIGITDNKFSDIFDVRLLKVLFPAYFIYIALVFVAFYFTKINIRTKSAIMVSSYRNNMAFIGMPILLYSFGNLASAKASIVIAILLPLNIIMTAVFYQVFKVSLNTAPDGRNAASSGPNAASANGQKSRIRSGFNVKRLLREIFLDPVIIAVLAGLLISYFNFQLPVPVKNIFSILSDMAVPLALISIGASFKFSHVKNNLKYLALISFSKLIVFPLIAMFFCFYVFKLGSLDASVIVILFGTPIAVATYMQSAKYDTDHDFISSAIITSTIASAVTLSVWLFIVKMFF
jgi:predicted permease